MSIMPRCPARVGSISCADPGPIIIGAVQGASCFGPAYEYLFIAESDLRKRKIRDKVKITYVTSEPFIGHLGLGGVGDTKGLLESALRDKHVNWICNAKVDKVESGMMYVTELDEDGQEKKKHELPFKHSMMLPAFKGVDAVFGIDKLTNPRGFILIDEHQRNPTYKNIYSIGVCVAIPPLGQTPVPTGVPKTGYMIESMVTATAHNIREELDGKQPSHKATWNALCLADFGDRGVAFLAMPQIPPRNVQWASEGPLGALGQDRLRKVLHAQGAQRHQRTHLRAHDPESHGHHALEEVRLLYLRRYMPEPVGGELFMKWENE